MPLFEPARHICGWPGHSVALGCGNVRRGRRPVPFWFSGLRQAQPNERRWNVKTNSEGFVFGAGVLGLIGATACVILWITNSMGITAWKFGFDPLVSAFLGYTGFVSCLIYLRKSRPKGGAVRT